MEIWGLEQEISHQGSGNDKALNKQWSTKSIHFSSLSQTFEKIVKL